MVLDGYICLMKEFKLLIYNCTVQLYINKKVYKLNL
jgi:hypothetical protein